MGGFRSIGASGPAASVRRTADGRGVRIFPAPRLTVTSQGSATGLEGMGLSWSNHDRGIPGQVPSFLAADPTDSPLRPPTDDSEKSFKSPQSSDTLISGRAEGAERRPGAMILLSGRNRAA
jgi:hypothetical protein